MAYFSGSLAVPKLYFVASESFTNGPIIGFSASIEVTRSMVYESGSPVGIYWGVSNYEISSYNYLSVAGTTIYGSDVLAFISTLKSSTDVDLAESCSTAFEAFLSDINVYSEYLSASIRLLPNPSGNIYITPASLSFGNVTVGQTSSYMSWTVRGINLSTNPIIITPPANYSMSITSGSGYSTASIQLDPTGGNVALTTIYTIFAPSAINVYSSSITASSVNSITRYLQVTGSGI